MPPLTSWAWRSVLALSPQLESAQCDEGAEDADDPEPHDDLGFLPAQLFKVVMQRCSEGEPALLSVLEVVTPLHVLEAVSLDDHRHHLGGEQRTDEGQNELR